MSEYQFRPLAAHMERVRALHRRDLACGGGYVALPDSLERKYPDAQRDLIWQWLFPASRMYCDPVSGQRRRHHAHETGLQRAVKTAARARLAACCVRCYEHRVTKRLQAIGNSAGIIIDKPILDLLGITPETELDLKTDGERLIITPVREPAQRARRLAKVQSRVVRKHERTFRKLAK